jgi:hypothetical protein
MNSGPAEVHRPMSRPVCFLPAVALLAAACIGPRPWWAGELEAWQGAPVEELMAAWGSPDRSESGPGGELTLVYESSAHRDLSQEALLDPNLQVVRESTEAAYEGVEDLDCTMYFQIANDVVERTRYEGAGCQVVSRDPRQRQRQP